MLWTKSKEKEGWSFFVNFPKPSGTKTYKNSSSLSPVVPILMSSNCAKGAVCRLQDVPIEEATSDIQKYLKSQLPKLSDNAGLAEVGRRAGGLFINAATAVNYVPPGPSMTRKEETTLLDKFLSWTRHFVPSKNAAALIDELYRQIMFEAFSHLEEEDLRNRLQMLYTCLCTAERTSPQTIARLTPDGDEETAELVLSECHAVLYVKVNQVFWCHGSFPNFIFSESRSNFSLSSQQFKY